MSFPHSSFLFFLHFLSTIFYEKLFVRELFFFLLYKINFPTSDKTPNFLNYYESIEKLTKNQKPKLPRAKIRKVETHLKQGNLQIYGKSINYFNKKSTSENLPKKCFIFFLFDWVLVSAQDPCKLYRGVDLKFVYCQFIGNTVIPITSSNLS